jgi:hypothetical protein
MRFHRLKRLFALRRFDRFCWRQPCQLAVVVARVFLFQVQRTLLGAVISSCLVASAPTPVSPLGSLPRLELFLLRPALWTFVLPFWEDRLLLGLGVMAGKGSVALLAAIIADVVNTEGLLSGSSGKEVRLRQQ